MNSTLLGLLLASLALDYVLSPFFKKGSVDREAGSAGYLRYYAYCALPSVLLFFLAGHRMSPVLLMPVVLGVLNGVANYFSWKAYRVSLSKTSVFTFFDDVIAIGLSYVLLKQFQVLNLWIISGTLLGLIAVVLLARLHYERKEPLEFFQNVAYYSVLWGVVNFAFGYYALSGLPVTFFIGGWYIGSFAAACAIWFIVRMRQTGAGGNAVHKGTEWFLLALAAVTVLARFTEYSVFSLEPLALIQPVFLVAEAMLPTAVGFFIFKELSKLTIRERLYLELGLVAALLVVIGL